MAPNIITSQKRDWRGYSAVKINALILMALALWIGKWSQLNVQEHWNVLEQVILVGVDGSAPLVDCKQGNLTRGAGIPCSIEKKINKRKRFLFLDRLRSSSANATRIRF